jgi:hypothetical protein
MKCQEVKTTAEMIRVDRQAVLAEAMNNNANYAQLAKEALATIDVGEPGTVEQIITEMTTRAVESAEQYSQVVENGLDNSKFIDTPAVRVFFIKRCDAIVINWRMYGEKLKKEIESQAA